jgi:hypothetical protein
LPEKFNFQSYRFNILNNAQIKIISILHRMVQYTKRVIRDMKNISQLDVRILLLTLFDTLNI